MLFHNSISLENKLKSRFAWSGWRRISVMFASIWFLFRTAPLPWRYFYFSLFCWKPAYSNFSYACCPTCLDVFLNNKAKLTCFSFITSLFQLFLFLEILILFPGRTSLIIFNTLQNNVCDSWFPFFFFCIKQIQTLSFEKNLLCLPILTRAFIICCLLNRRRSYGSEIFW